MNKILGIEQAINASNWDKKSTWAKLARKLGSSVKPWPYAYYDRFVKNSKQGILDNTRD